MMQFPLIKAGRSPGECQISLIVSGIHVNFIGVSYKVEGNILLWTQLIKQKKNLSVKYVAKDYKVFDHCCFRRHSIEVISFKTIST